MSQQNSIIKTREDKYRSKIKALETLVNGTNEENEVNTKVAESSKCLSELILCCNTDYSYVVPSSDGNKSA